MPLPSVSKYGAKQCTALNRQTKEQCKNPAAFGCKVCRYHGAHLIKRGEQAPGYKHGGYTQENIKRNSEKTAELQMLENLGFSLSFMSGNKTAGRKSKAYRKNR
jgi:hypothetical protein